MSSPRLGLPRDAYPEDGVCDCSQHAGDSDNDNLVGFAAYFEGLCDWLQNGVATGCSRCGLEKDIS